MRIFRSLLLLCLLCAHDASAVPDVNQTRRHLDQIGARIDQLLASGGHPNAWESDAELEALLQSENDDDDALLALGQQLVCKLPADESLTLLRAWSQRFERGFELAAADPDDVEEMAEQLPTVQWLGVQSTIALNVIASVGSRCPDVALDTLDRVEAATALRFAGNAELNTARFALTRLALRRQAEPGSVDVHAWLNGVQRLKRAVHSTRPSQGALIEDLVETVDHYEAELRRVALSPQSPLWQVDPSRRTPRVGGHVVKCFSGLGGVLNAVMLPGVPNEVQVLQSEALPLAAGAYALADLFDSPGQAASGIEYDPAAVVWAAWGKAHTAAQLEQAIANIELIAAPGSAGSLAIIRVFGHAFVIESGRRMDAAPTHWYDAVEVAHEFRQSAVYRRLSGTDASP